MPKYEITAEFTPHTIKTVSRRFVLRLLGTRYFVALVIMAIFLSYLVLNRVNEWTTGAIAAVLGLGILFPFILWWKTERSGLARLHRMSTPNVKFVFDDHGVTTDSELGAATVGWKSIEKIWEFPEAWLLFADKRQYVTVPRNAMTGDLKQVIKTEVEKNRPKRP
jgi:YcxB-like protein